MPGIEIDLDPVQTIKTDAIGQPGQRVFYIQGKKDDQVITLIVEKIQVQTLAAGVDDFLKEINERYPDLTPASSEYQEEDMHIQPPVEPLFRVGELGLAYDSSRDMMVLVAREIVGSGMQNEDANVVRFWCTRSQVLAMSAWGAELANRGRQICPLCGEPMDPAGHFCPKRNGHKH